MKKKLSKPLLEKAEANVDTITISAADTRRLLGICIDLLAVCTRVTRQVDPAVGAMIAFARDEVLDNVIRGKS